MNDTKEEKSTLSVGRLVHTLMTQTGTDKKKKTARPLQKY